MVAGQPAAPEYAKIRELIGRVDDEFYGSVLALHPRDWSSCDNGNLHGDTDRIFKDCIDLNHTPTVSVRPHSITTRFTVLEGFLIEHSCSCGSFKQQFARDLETVNWELHTYLCPLIGCQTSCMGALEETFNNLDALMDVMPRHIYLGAVTLNMVVPTHTDSWHPNHSYECEGWTLGENIDDVHSWEQLLEELGATGYNTGLR